VPGAEPSMSATSSSDAVEHGTSGSSIPPMVFVAADSDERGCMSCSWRGTPFTFAFCRRALQSHAA
jgi:hypothetical protein